MPESLTASGKRCFIQRTKTRRRTQWTRTRFVFVATSLNLHYQSNKPKLPHENWGDILGALVDGDPNPLSVEALQSVLTGANAQNLGDLLGGYLLGLAAEYPLKAMANMLVQDWGERIGPVERTDFVVVEAWSTWRAGGVSSSVPTAEVFSIPCDQIPKGVRACTGR